MNTAKKPVLVIQGHPDCAGAHQATLLDVGSLNFPPLRSLIGSVEPDSHRVSCVISY